MKTFLKSHWKLISIVSAAVVAVVVTVVLCVCLIPPRDDGTTTPVKTAFDAPANVRVDGDELKWNAVEGSDGYTVKIGDDETTVVKTTSLDLTTATAKLVEGENKLSVKVNATDERYESAYSLQVTYTYVVTPPPPAKTPFDAPANLKIEGDELKWDAVGGASEYTVKIGENTTKVTTNSLDLTTVTDMLVEGDNKISVKANAAGDKLDSAYTAEVTYVYTAPAPEKTPFATPANLKIEGDTLAWDAVDGASEYTVKIGSDETTIVTTNSLDLTTVTQKLASGENKIAVRANENDEHKASEYSAETTYEYHPPVETEAADYAALVDAIGDLTEDDTAEDAAEVAAAITAAENKYNGLSDEAKANETVIAKKAAFDEKKGAYTEVYTAATTAYEAFATALDEATAEVEKAENLENLTEKADAAEALYTELSTLAESMLTEEQTTAYDSLATTVEEWTAAVEEAEADWADAPETAPETDEEAEEVIAAAQPLVDAYAEYPAYVKTALTPEYAAVSALLENSKTKIETTVNAIKTAAEAALENTEPNEANYAALEEQQTALEGVTGAYATEYLATFKVGEDSLLTAVTNAMNTMLATVVRSDDGEAYSLTGTTLKITLFRTFYNFNGDKIATTDGENAPKLTVKGNTVTVEQDFEKNALNEYVAIINIENLGVMGDDATYTVKVGSEEIEEPLKFGATLAYNPYFTDINEEIEGVPTGFKKAITVAGEEPNIVTTFNMTFDERCTAQNYYLEVYNAGAITVDGSFVKFSEMPLGKIDVTGKTAMVIEDFNRFIANSELGGLFVDKGPVNVRFMIYGETVTDGVPAFTDMNASVISEAIEFNLVDADKYYTLPVGQSINNAIDTDANGTMFMVVYNNMLAQDGLLDKINNTLTNAGVEGVTLNCDADGNGNYKEYLQTKIEVYDTTDPENSLYTAYREIGFRTVTVNDVLTEWAQNYYRKNGDATKDINYTIGIRISFWAKPNTAITKYFPRAEYMEAGITHDQNVGQVKYEKAIKLGDYAALPSAPVFTNGFDVTRDPVTMNLFKNGDAIGAHLKLYQLDGTTEKNVNYMYLEVDDNLANKLVIYKADENGVKNDDIKIYGNYAPGNADLGIYNVWVTKDALENFFKDEGNGFVFESAFDWDDGWRIDSRLVVNPESNDYFFDSAWRNDYIAPKVEKTPKPTNVCQIQVEDSLNLNFCRFGQPSGNGSVFNDKFGVTYVELEMRLSSTAADTYKMYLFKDGDHYVLYKNADKLNGTARTTTADYIMKVDFENWVKEEYGLSTFELTENVEFRTKVCHNNTYFTEEADYSGWVKKGVSPNDAAAA